MSSFSDTAPQGGKARMAFSQALNPRRSPFRLLQGSAVGLIAASWISASAFGLYIFGFYIAAIHSGRMPHWNDNLPGLYDPNHRAALVAMAAHLAAGAIILLLGPIQFITRLRHRWPAFHRWTGRLYVLTSAIAGAGGLIFIAVNGTIGGVPMSVGFALYGALVAFAAEETYRNARAGRMDTHRAWSIRLFALAIGSWLYRMDYGFWLLAAHGLGHLESFRGPFDVVMAYFFYLPNLLVAELFLRARRSPSHPAFRAVAAVALNSATLLVAVGSYYFIRYYWGPGIVHGLLGGKS